MLFVKQEDLKVGMRLAKPIYNKKGVLLYERDSKLTTQGIASVKNFGLIGIYILEPAEPLPPMTDDDVAFEKFQAVAVFTIVDELQYILQNGRQSKMVPFAENILREYGRLSRKINFVQNLRSKEDFIYKHSLNVALLCAMIGHQLGLRYEEHRDLIIAALIHDIGKLNVPRSLLDKTDRTPEDKYEMKLYEQDGVRLSEDAFAATPNIKRMVSQAFNEYDAFESGEKTVSKIVLGSRILVVANDFDKMTAMSNYMEPKSEIATLKHLLGHPEMYDPQVVEALTKSINFLSNGCCVELSNGEKGLVVQANDSDVLKPMILCFSDNSIVNLATTDTDLEVKDVMKTLDNRYVMDMKMIDNLNT